MKDCLKSVSNVFYVCSMDVSRFFPQDASIIVPRCLKTFNHSKSLNSFCSDIFNRPRNKKQWSVNSIIPPCVLCIVFSLNDRIPLNIVLITWIIVSSLVTQTSSCNNSSYYLLLSQWEISKVWPIGKKTAWNKAVKIWSCVSCREARASARTRLSPGWRASSSVRVWYRVYCYKYCHG